MKKNILIASLGIIISLVTTVSCGYEERGHANTPAENPGSQIKTGTDTFAHPGNIDRDTIVAH